MEEQDYSTQPAQALYLAQDCLLFSWAIVDHFDIHLLLAQMKRLFKHCQIDELDGARLLTSASELAWNMIKYAKGGQLSLWGRSQGDRTAFLLKAEDQGPGINNIQLALQDEYSTGHHSLGLGLPGIRRMMDALHIKTSNRGTLVFTMQWIEFNLSLVKEKANVLAQAAITPLPTKL
jgi:serine/threonine-protein kinase RsbT